MHIPPLFKKRNWQILIIGICIGGITAYSIIIFMYGEMYEKLFEKNLHLQEEIIELTNRNDTLLKDKEDFDEKQSELLMIETVVIDIRNEDEMDFDRLSLIQLKQLIKREVDHIIGKNLQTVSENDQLLISSIENKPFKLGDFFYYFRVYQLTITNHVKITLEAKLSKD